MIIYKALGVKASMGMAGLYRARSEAKMLEVEFHRIF